ncbi:MAG: hypothetical protein USCAAHI_00521 [Beijerinckiaceae bacterium]|nr:MAG: hypothetical protein USCAAHI_00521 [Beijerinckiaceae bacterium]
MYLISVDAETEAFQAYNLCQISVEHHVKNTFVDGALSDATRGIAQAIPNIIQLQIVAASEQHLLEIVQRRGDDRGLSGRWRRGDLAIRRRRVQSSVMCMRNAVQIGRPSGEEKAANRDLEGA